MRHDLLPLPIPPGPPGVRKAPRPRVLVASPRLAQARSTRLLPTPHAAVALPAVATAAQQHFTLAQRTRVHPPRVTHSTLGPDSRHRRLRSELPSASGVAVLKRWTRPVRQCNTLPALCALHGGARRFEQLSGRLGRRARSDSQGGTVLLLSALCAQGRHSLACRLRRPALLAPPLFVCRRRRLVHRGGRASPMTNARPPRWASRVRSTNLARASSMPPNQPAIGIAHARPAQPCWVSSGERRGVNSDERQRPRRARSCAGVPAATRTPNNSGG